jgi:hypothetical protein
MPFRTITTFYQPEREKSTEGIKVYPQKFLKSDVMNQKG